MADILKALREKGQISERELERIVRRHNRDVKSNADHYSKKHLLPYYLHVKNNEPALWERWQVDTTLEKKLYQLLQIKPRRTASGVATITVMTKPWKCSSDCLYCPNDICMPKSYLSDEPVCQRAERNYFDPYLQVAARLRALTRMGHVTDKIELIVLGGTWNDYPEGYRIWFVKEMFRALNEVKMSDAATLQKAEDASAQELQRFYEGAGLSNSKKDIRTSTRDIQQTIMNGKLTYNQAFDQLYGESAAWHTVAKYQSATFAELEHEHTVNETANHRVVGLVIETRPDTLNLENLALLRRLGCTKIQMGVQSVNPEILKLNKRNISLEKIQDAFALLRVFGFKIHAHFMVNLYGATPKTDKEDYRIFTTHKAYLPDEVKLYPCVLVEGTKLCDLYDSGDWQPYNEAELLDVLTYDTRITPAFMRISRMIRDISAHDIVAGNKKANLRQLVENELTARNETVTEIRYREISTSTTSASELSLEVMEYETTISHEFFLQWVTVDKHIAGFLRLSLPDEAFVWACQKRADDARNTATLNVVDTLGSVSAPANNADQEQRAAFPIKPGQAMIREVHVYGTVAGLHKTGKGAQHLGLGKQLIAHAETIAKEHGYTSMNVISSVGTREYYRKQGFIDDGLYQRKLFD